METIRPEDIAKDNMRMFGELYFGKKDDPVSHPSHYTSGSIECIDAMESAFGRREVITFSKLNAFKYLWRAELKNNELQDLKKASWYLNKAIELLDEELEETVRNTEVYHDPLMNASVNKNYRRYDLDGMEEKDILQRH